MADTGSGNGNGELTREILRAELRAGLEGQENKFRRMLDVRLAPINDHIARVDRGELTPAQEAAIERVVEKGSEQKLARRNMRIPILSLIVSCGALCATVMLTLTGLHVV